METVRKTTADGKKWRLAAIVSAFFHPVSRESLKDTEEKLRATMARADETMRLVEEQKKEVNAVLKHQ